MSRCVFLDMGEQQRFINHRVLRECCLALFLSDEGRKVGHEERWWALAEHQEALDFAAVFLALQGVISDSREGGHTIAGGGGI